MRHDPSLSLTQAARLQGVKPATVKKYFPKALKQSQGRFKVTKSDRYAETLYLPDARGNPVPAPTRSFKERKRASNYLRDLGRFYRGDRKAVSKWHRKKIAGVELVTDERTLIAIEPGLSDFSLYRSSNAGGA